MMAIQDPEVNALKQLYRAQYLNLTTFRKNGVAVPTPVWFAEHDGTIYVETGEESGKVKRIRHTSRISMVPCTISGKKTGAEITGQGRLITTTEEIFIAKGAMHRKYGLQRSLYYFVMELAYLVSRGPVSGFAYLAITPGE